MIDYSPLLSLLQQHGQFSNWAKSLPEQIAQGLSTQRYGDLPTWYAALEALPQVNTEHMKLDRELHIGNADELTTEQQERLESSLKALIPWRKGPFQLFNVFIDAEWRSDLKWQRLQPHIASLQERSVLDVGCGNGYYCWRMLGQGARRVIGIDPSPRFVVQFYMTKHFTQQQAIDVLPLGIESLPANLEAFDTTFSMGVLYHRRSPMDHLRELKGTLRPGGELVLETLVIDGKLGEALVPEGRYGMMNNVWFLPSVLSLESWLRKCGFRNIRCVDTSRTRVEEQRATPWMRFQSLSDFLDPNDSSKTAEGHPAPTRAIFVANKPS